MVIRRLLCTMFALAVVTSTAFAQGKLNGARKDIADRNYITAIDKLQKTLQSKDDPEAKSLLADCYRLINDTENAEYWYSQAVTATENAPINKLHYAMMLQVNGKCDQAQDWYGQYTAVVPDDTRGQHLSRACQYTEELMTKNAGIFEIAHMSFNSNLDDYAPAINGDKVIFASDRDHTGPVKRKHMWTGNDFADLYSVDFKRSGDNPGAYRYARSEKFSKVVNAKYHEAAVSFADEGNTMYFTRNNYLNGREGKSDDGIIKLKVYYATGKNGSFGSPKDLPFNSDEYSVAHPSLSADSKKLYFSSDMPGGFGGMDLYVSDKDGDTWGPPVNLGPGVNTEGNEIFPFIDKNNRLYFGSDGQMGLGGLDQYYSTLKGENEWNVPVNLGFPINTTNDDFGLVMDTDGFSGYFTSDRTGGAGRDDIYGFKKSAAAVEIFVYDALTKEPISGADVKYILGGTNMLTGPDGLSQLDMKLNECSDFTAMFAGYDNKTIKGCTKDAKPGENVRIEIPLSKLSAYKLEGIVFDMTNGLPATGAKVSLSNDCGLGATLPVVTDETGRYTFDLAKDCCYTVKAEKDGFIASSAANNCTKGQPDNTTLQANLNLTPYTPSSANGGAITTTTPGSTTPGKSDMSGTKPAPNNGTANVNTPKYNSKSGLYEGKDGRPANADLGNGMVIKNGVMYENGTATKPADVAFETGADGSFLLNIYYDFDQATIRQVESEEELNKLLTMLTDNPEFIVEIASHTDARGSDSYNYTLSQRRADAVVKWLSGKGVKRDRLMSHGYGETQLTNTCKNHVRCNEKDHQMNRRTEFRILGCKGGSNISISQPKANIKIDKCAGCPF
jgi:outer membrane protein OmpA-like peptidoglycan-associated protein